MEDLETFSNDLTLVLIPAKMRFQVHFLRVAL